MFSEYTSKFLSQSQAGGSSVHGDQRNTAPLFHSVAEEDSNHYNNERGSESDLRSPSLYYSTNPKLKRSTMGSGWISSFGKKPINEAEEHEEDSDLEPQWQPMVDSVESNMDSVQLDTKDDIEPPPDLAVEGEDGGDVESGRQISSPQGIGMQPFSPSVLEVPAQVTLSVVLDDTKYDQVWATAFLTSQAMLFATSMLIWLQTTVPRIPLGDTIYTVIKNSWSTIFIAMTVAMCVSFAWILTMKRYATGLMYATVIGFPIGLFIMTIYPAVMSYRTPDGGFGSQDKAIRWVSLLPLLVAAVWCGIMYKARRALTRSLGIVQLACNMVGENPLLVVVGIFSVIVFLLVTLIWVGLFGRVFLQGHVFKKRWVLDAKSWAFGAWYCIMYLWTWGVVSGLIRATVAATISQWYFHRHEQFPRYNSFQVVRAAFNHAIFNHFGTICFASFIALLVRLPMVVLPRRLVSVVQLIVFNLMSASAISVTTPLALTNAVISSQSLLDSARTVGTLRHIQLAPSTTNSAYVLSKMILTAARGVTAVGLALACWIHAATYTNGGSLYGYIVGMIAGFIGWVVLGATEGVLSNAVDASYLCHALDHSTTTTNNDSTNQPGHCADADAQFSL